MIEYKDFFDAYKDFAVKNFNIMKEFYSNTFGTEFTKYFSNEYINSFCDANKIIFEDKDFIEEKLKVLKENLEIIFRKFSANISKNFNGTEILDEAILEKNFVHPKDKRFSSDDWNNSAFFTLIKDSYGLFSKWLIDVYESKQDKITEFKNVEFILKQFIDAVAPSNFPFLNPTVIKKIIDTNGESLINGMRNFIEDISSGKTLLNQTTNLPNYYIPGKNVAMTRGKVIYQNDMMQLIQYESQTEENYKIPLLIIPPWINKYYVLDLSENNSFVKWLVESGFTVFILSWVNPDSQYRNKSFENYCLEGLIAALDKIHEVLNVTETNVLGYCLGGTLLASTIAMLKHEDSKIHLKNNIKTASFIATLTNFKNVGDFKLFTSERYISYIESLMQKKGFLDRDVMFKTFNLLKANDMIWSTFVNNYLLGNDPIKKDILSWNSDTTNMPFAMHSFLLRNMYQNNMLKVPGGIKLLGTPIDLRKVNIPTFMVALEKDHIAPWSSTYDATKLFSGPMKFVLGGSGHVAGVINSIKDNKYYYYTNDNTSTRADKWLKNAEKHAGSWWNEYLKWITNFSGEKVKSRTIENYIENAPGSYVLNFVPKIIDSIKISLDKTKDFVDAISGCKNDDNSKNMNDSSDAFETLNYAEDIEIQKVNNENSEHKNSAKLNKNRKNTQQKIML